MRIDCVALQIKLIDSIHMLDRSQQAYMVVLGDETLDAPQELEVVEAFELIVRNVQGGNATQVTASVFTHALD